MFRQESFTQIEVESWNISEVCEWLDSIGLGRYIESFSNLYYFFIFSQHLYLYIYN